MDYLKKFADGIREKYAQYDVGRIYFSWVVDMDDGRYICSVSGNHISIIKDKN